MSTSRLTADEAEGPGWFLPSTSAARVLERLARASANIAVTDQAGSTWIGLAEQYEPGAAVIRVRLWGGPEREFVIAELAAARVLSGSVFYDAQKAIADRQRRGLPAHFGPARGRAAP